MTALDQVANFKKVTVSIGYGAADTSIALATGQGAKLPDPANGQYNLVWWNATDYADPADDPNVEIVRVTALLADTITVTRAQEGTAATQKQNVNKIYKMMLGLTAKMITDITAQGGVFSETPIGAIDGLNVTYSVSKFITSVLALAVNGQYLSPSDFSASGNIISLNSPLDASLAGAAFTLVYQGFPFYSETPAGMVDGLNCVFLVANQITAIINISINNGSAHPIEYSAAGRTITFSLPVNASLAGSPFIINYI